MRRLYLLRHGQSHHNYQLHQSIEKYQIQHLKWWEIEDKYDPKIIDSDLTHIGINQAKQVNEQMRIIQPSLVITSPLIRSLRTAFEACQEINPIFHITPLLREHTYSLCDLGSNSLKLIQYFPNWESQLQSLHVDWWCNNEEQKQYFLEDYHSLPPHTYREPWQHLQDRISSLISVIDNHFLAGHQTIVLVGHAVLFYGMTGRWVENCQLIEFDIDQLRPRCNCSGDVCLCE
jgi:broad specificity phosphatase PhoE